LGVIEDIASSNSVATFRLTGELLTNLNVSLTQVFPEVSEVQKRAMLFFDDFKMVDSKR